MSLDRATIGFTVNGGAVSVSVPPVTQALVGAAGRTASDRHQGRL